MKIYRWANPLLVLMIKSKWSFHMTIAQSYIMTDTQNLRYPFKNRWIQLLFRQNSFWNFFKILVLICKLQFISSDLKPRPFKFPLTFWCTFIRGDNGNFDLLHFFQPITKQQTECCDFIDLGANICW